MYLDKYIFENSQTPLSRTKRHLKHIMCPDRGERQAKEDTS